MTIRDSTDHFLAQLTTNLNSSYDMAVSESKRKGDMKGRPNPAQENCDGSDLDICPDLILAALGAALAAGFAILFTLITAAGRRKKRSAAASSAPVHFTDVLEDISWNLGK